jgi:putative hydrolase of the HAD superfamily
MTGLNRAQALPRAMLIDMDDTLINLTSTSNRCWDELCTSYAPRLGDLVVDEFRAMLTTARADYWRDPARHRPGRLDLLGARRAILAQVLDKLGRADLDLAHEMAHAFTEAQLGSIEAFPGAIEAVQTLRAQGVKLALITNGEAAEQRRKITRFDLAPLFDIVMVEGEFGVGKPDPAVYHHALGALGAAPHEAWMVGDNLEWEVAVPQQLGLYTVWVDFEGKGLPPTAPAQPDRIIRNLAELVN